MAGAAVSQAVRAGWASFDRCVIMGQAGGVAPSSSAAAVSRTINGREVRVSLRLAAPPAASYVQLDTDDRDHGRDAEVVATDGDADVVATDGDSYVQLGTDDCDHGGDAEVTAADGDLLLVHMLVEAEGTPSWRLPDKDNFFVYKADPERPWLECLPSLGGWMGVARHTGVARCGAKDLFVADLQLRAVRLSAGGMGEVAELFRYSSATQRWELNRLDMPRGVGLLCFETEAVFSFGGSMCCADYHRGILFCDVAADDPSLRFVRFPLAEFWDVRDFGNGRGLPEKYRAACVSRGRLWFVDVHDGRFRRDRRSSCSSDGTVTTWTLRMPELEWTKEHTLRFSELWSHWKYQQSPLPRSMPGFPMVDMRQADVLHFIVQGPWESPEPHWTITVDMRNRCLASYEVYQNAIEVPEAERDVSNIFFNESLICCELGGVSANALGKHAGD